MSEAILIIVVVLQCYVIYLFLRIIENVARFVLLLAATTLLGYASLEFLPRTTFYITNAEIDCASNAMSFTGHTDSSSSWLPFEFCFAGELTAVDAAVGFYLLLLVLIGICLYFVPILDALNEERRTTRALLKLEIQDRIEARSRTSA
ncbi:hypothetical protein [Rhodophyticola sp.]|jgi:hypothetical protein|uniref:hypothetical protein n=1 Tax=Rhodophyticola sp. TaxID=2680032 RepID=UPI003D2D5EC2